MGPFQVSQPTALPKQPTAFGIAQSCLEPTTKLGGCHRVQVNNVRVQVLLQMLLGGRGHYDPLVCEGKMLENKLAMKPNIR